MEAASHKYEIKLGDKTPMKQGNNYKAANNQVLKKWHVGKSFVLPMILNNMFVESYF